MMLSTVEPAFARTDFNITAKSFMVGVPQNIASGQVEAVLRMIKHLRSMGVSTISLDGETISLDVLEKLVRDGSPTAVAAIGKYAATAQTQRVRFQVGALEIASVEARTSLFPVSSSA